MSESIDKSNLVERTRSRHRAIWEPINYYGLLTPLLQQQVMDDTLALASVESSLDVYDEPWDIKESQRDQTIQLEQFGINQDQQIVDQKVATDRAKIAIQRATEIYVVAAMLFDSKVKALIMTVKEYAAQVQLEQMDLEQRQVTLGIAKEGLHLDQINAQIYYEAIAQAQVEADLAKAQVDVAKANVRAIMADIAAGEADIKVLQTQVEVAMADADKATLQADVASIYAEVLSHQLSAIKLAVGQEEIDHGFGYIQTHLDDMLQLWDLREVTQNILTLAENEYKAEVGLELTAQEQAEDLRLTEIQNALLTQEYEKDATSDDIVRLQALQNILTNMRVALIDARTNQVIQKDNKDTWGQDLVYAAQAAVASRKHVQRFIDTGDFTTRTIS